MNEQKMLTDFKRLYPEVTSKKDPMYHVLLNHFQPAYEAGWQAGQAYHASRRPMKDHVQRK